MPAKRIVSAVLALLLAVSFAAPSGARADSDAGFEYSVEGTSATVTGCTSTCPTTLVIPGTLGGFSVTAIANYAFDVSSLTTVTIPNSVMTIGDWAFSDNRSLTSVTIGNSVTSIGIYAFYDSSLTTVTIPNSVMTIGDAAFLSSSLTTVTIGSSVESIGNDAFADNSIISLTIPNSVTSIGSGAFAYSDLTTLNLGSRITTIGSYAFSNNRLTAVTIGSSVTSIGNGAFSYNRLTSVKIPKSVTTISYNAFAHNFLTTLNLGNSITTIGDYAFSYNHITALKIGSSVTSIGGAAFAKNRLTAVTIPNSVISIGAAAFYGNRLTSAIFLGDAPTAGSGTSPFLFNQDLAAVTRSNTATGWESTWGGKPVVIADARATATVKPTVTGSATVGMTLTAAKGTWTGYPTPTFTYQWYACTTAVSAARSNVPATCTTITGATKSTFKLTAFQRNKYVAVLVKGTSLRTTATSWLSTTTAKVR